MKDENIISKTETTAPAAAPETNTSESTTAPHAEERRQKALERACLVARIADDHRGQDTVVLDLTAITSLFDYFVITSGTSRRQMHAVAEEVDRIQENMGTQRLGLEGYRESVWIVQDYGDIVLHVLTPEAREAYDLEGLWADAKRVDWETIQPVRRGR